MAKSQFKKIMLIDDDDINNELNQIILDKSGFADEVNAFLNATDALEYLKGNCLNNGSSNCPEIIFLDVKMPRMDGFQFMEELKKASWDFTHKAPIVMLTSSVDENDYRKAQQYKIAGYFNKPLSMDLLQKIKVQVDSFPDNS